MITEGIREAYETGRGSVAVRAKISIEDSADSNKARGPSKKRAVTGKPLIVVTELPYQTNKVSICTNIAKLVMSKRCTC